MTRRTGFTRRELLEAGLAVGALAGLGPLACVGGAVAVTPRPEGAGEGAFLYGVASGDPLADRVVLWTRVSPPDAQLGDSVEVRWRLARDPELRDVAARGALVTGPERDFTVKVDAEGLEAGRTFWYGFESLGTRSRVGRTRTLPADDVGRLRFAVASCANLPQGFFNVYARIAARDDLDAVLHLGDYLYEYANGTYGDGTALGRLPEPLHEIVSLADYRTRHARYKRDADLQALHAAHPMIAVWDDHESANNAWQGGAQNHQPEREGDWPARRAAAERAYHEWMPVRPLPGDLVGPRLWRSFRFGDLADLVMLDTRLYGRDRQVGVDDVAGLEDPGRSLLGRAQEAWLEEQLSASQRDGVAWRLLGQQVMFAPGAASQARSPNPDSWDGYRAGRGRLLAHLADQQIADVVILTGDVHSSWAWDVAPEPFSPAGYDPASGRGALAVELVTPAVSSPPLGRVSRIAERVARLPETHPHLRYVEIDHRGYLLVDLSRERARAEWWHVPDVTRRSEAEQRAAAFEARRGTSHLRAAG